MISSFGTLNFLQYSNILVYRKFTADSFSEHESRLNHQSRAAIAAKFRLFNSFLYLCLIYGGKNFASTIGLFCCEGLSWLRFFTSCSEFPLFCYTGPDEVKHQHKCLHENKHNYMHKINTNTNTKTNINKNKNPLAPKYPLLLHLA